MAGVNPADAPWGITSLDAIIKTNRDIRAVGEGVLLWGADRIGSRGGPRQVILSLFCRAGAAVPPATAGALNLVPFNSEPVDLNVDGDLVLRGKHHECHGRAAAGDLR